MPLAICVSIPNFYSSFTLLKHTHLFPVPMSHPTQAVHLLGGLFFPHVHLGNSYLALKTISGLWVEEKCQF